MTLIHTVIQWKIKNFQIIDTKKCTFREAFAETPTLNVWHIKWIKPKMDTVPDHKRCLSSSSQTQSDLRSEDALWRSNMKNRSRQCYIVSSCFWNIKSVTGYWYWSCTNTSVNERPSGKLVWRMIWLRDDALMCLTWSSCIVSPPHTHFCSPFMD